MTECVRTAQDRTAWRATCRWLWLSTLRNEDEPVQSSSLSTTNSGEQRRKPWGDTSPQNLEWGKPMYNVPPDFDIFSVFFP